MLDRDANKLVRVAYPVRDLSYVVSQGGRLRRHRYVRDLREFLWPTLIAVVAQILTYLLVITRFGRNDWYFIAIGAVAMSLVPIAAACILAGLRRHGSAIFTSILVALGLFSAAVSVLSGLRIPISYQAMAACLPSLVLIMAYANVRHQRSFRARVALADFSRAGEVAAELGSVPVLRGDEAELANLEILLIDPREHHSERWSHLLATCYLRGIEIMSWTSYREILLGRLDIASFEISHLAYSPSQLMYARCKRIIDIVVVLLSLLLTLPIALAVAIYIGVRDGFPVIFVQVRRGYGGRRFRMYKFRTMYRGTEGGATDIGDSRVIPGCQLIRKFRFDEIPQLLNILRGDMSLIGPRPVAEYVARSSAQAEPKYELRSLVPPGITGWAQVKCGYASTSDEEIEKLSYDLYYIKHLSLDLDLQIVFQTFRTVVFGVGAR
jgi:lipopolysaccharide/colanic/teichoic acid biosynthesis glycosyltransferase